MFYFEILKLHLRGIRFLRYHCLDVGSESTVSRASYALLMSTLIPAVLIVTDLATLSSQLSHIGCSTGLDTSTKPVTELDRLAS